MANWYGVQRKSDLSIVSYVSDDVVDYEKLPDGLQLTAVFPSQEAAQATLQPAVVTPTVTLDATLAAKPASDWTLADFANWIKGRGL